jgi:hypothetical protein
VGNGEIISTQNWALATGQWDCYFNNSKLGISHWAMGELFQKLKTQKLKTQNPNNSTTQK